MGVVDVFLFVAFVVVGALGGGGGSGNPNETPIHRKWHRNYGFVKAMIM